MTIRRLRGILQDMKKCTWCGKEYPDAAEVCAIDGQALTALTVGEPQEAKAELRRSGAEAVLDAVEEIAGSVRGLRFSEIGSSWQPEMIDVNQIEGAFEFAEGYSRPNWKLIRKAIEQGGSSRENIRSLDGSGDAMGAAGWG